MNTTQTFQLTTIKNYALTQLKDDKTGHSGDHLQRVASMVQKIATHYEQADLFLALSAAYLHDVIDDKLFEPTAKKAQLEAFLTEIALPYTQVNAILEIITSISFAHSLEHAPQLSLEAQIVQDADWLDAIGAIGITRAIYFGGAHQEKIYDPTIPVRTQLTKESYRNLTEETIMNHFHEKLFLLKDKLNTPYAKKIAQQRHQFMETFYAQFMAEWQADK